jgi:hypothetical protein
MEMASVMGKQGLVKIKEKLESKAGALIYTNTKLARHVRLHVSTISNTDHLLAMMNIPL